MVLEFILFFVLSLLFYLHIYSNNKSKCVKKRKAKFPPGPVGLPIFGYLPFLGKIPYLTISNLTKKYGKIFSLKMGQMDVVFINDYDAMKDLYKLDSFTGRFQMEVFEKRGKFGLLLLEGKQWQELRRFLLKCLKEAGLGPKMESSILEEVLQVRKVMSKNINKPVYVKPMVEIAVINALWGLIAGEKYDIEDPLKKEVLYILTEGVADQNLVGIGAFIPWLAKMFPEITGYNKGMKYFDVPERLVKEIFDKHKESYSPGNERDFIDHALKKIYETTDENSVFYKEIGMRNIFYTLIDILFAGADTLSSTLGWTFLYLSIYPEVQEKVFEEIERVVGSLRIPNLEDRPKCPYVEATMQEVLRISSMVPLGLFHRTLQDIEYENYFFPDGTLLLANIYHIHHEHEYWIDPHNFRPDRFITETGQFRRDERVIPFFIGKRSCPGEGLAMIEYFLFLTGILQKYKFSLDPNQPKPDLSPANGFIITPPKHMLIVTER